MNEFTKRFKAETETLEKLYREKNPSGFVAIELSSEQKEMICYALTEVLKLLSPDSEEKVRLEDLLQRLGG